MFSQVSDTANAILSALHKFMFVYLHLENNSAKDKYFRLLSLFPLGSYYS